MCSIKNSTAISCFYVTWITQNTINVDINSNVVNTDSIPILTIDSHFI